MADFNLGAKLKESLESFLAFMQAPNIKTIGDVVQFNKDHADAALPPGKFAISLSITPRPDSDHQATITKAVLSRRQ